jgi:exodeoxyribonuclease-3
MFTWWAPWRNMRQRNIGWRLDYLLATRSVFDAVGRCVVRRDFGTSDHAPVFAEYAIGAAVGPPEVKLPAPAAIPPDPQGTLF